MHARDGVEERLYGFGRMMAIGTLSALLLALAGGGSAAQEQTTPPPVIPSPPAEASRTETPLPSVANEVDSGAPHLQTVAQGLVTLEGPVVWRVREVAPSGEADTEAAAFSFNLQRDGASIIRHEGTGERIRLETGEAYFMAGDDPHVRAAAGAEPSRLWVFELVAPDAAAGEGLGAGTVLFTSDIIDDYPAGTVDVEFMRGTLLGNEVAELPAHTGPALVMVTSGRVQASADGAAPTSVNAGTGQLTSGSLTLRNPDAAPAVFVVAAIGEVVDQPEAARGREPTPTAGAPAPETDDGVAADDEAAANAGEEPAAASDDGETEDEGVPAAEEIPAGTVLDTDGDGLSDEDEAAYGSDPLNRDYDADRLLDGAEVNQYGTDPLNNDTDGDGLVDGDEVEQFGTNPASTDGDGDGLIDADEIYVYGTGAAVFDTDGDGVGDGEEVLVFGTDPNDPSSGP